MTRANAFKGIEHYLKHCEIAITLGEQQGQDFFLGGKANNCYLSFLVAYNFASFSSNKSKQ